MSSLTVFQFDSNFVRTIIIDGQSWFVAKDIAEILEYAATSRMLPLVDDDDKREINPHDYADLVQSIPGNTFRLAIVNESGLYACIFGSKKAESKRFKTWVTSEVLPQIRKTGKFEAKNLSKLEILEMALVSEKEMIAEKERRLLAEIKVEQLEDKNIELQEQRMIDAPFTSLGQAIEVAEGNLKVGEYGKIIGIGQNKLFEILRDKAILSNTNSNWNVPYQKYINQGYFECTEKVTVAGIKIVTLITPKGQVWLQRQLNNIFVIEVA